MQNNSKTIKDSETRQNQIVWTMPNFPLKTTLISWSISLSQVFPTNKTKSTNSLCPSAQNLEGKE